MADHIVIIVINTYLKMGVFIQIVYTIHQDCHAYILVVEKFTIIGYYSSGKKAKYLNMREEAGTNQVAVFIVNLYKYS